MPRVSTPRDNNNKSNVANKQIESLEYLTKEINELKSAVLNGTVIIESIYVSRETRLITKF